MPLFADTYRDIGNVLATWFCLVLTGFGPDLLAS